MYLYILWIYVYVLYLYILVVLSPGARGGKNPLKAWFRFGETIIRKTVKTLKTCPDMGGGRNCGQLEAYINLETRGRSIWIDSINIYSNPCTRKQHWQEHGDLQPFPSQPMRASSISSYTDTAGVDSEWISTIPFFILKKWQPEKLLDK